MNINQLPNNNSDEECILSIILTSSNYTKDTILKFDEEIFFNLSNQLIYKTIIKLLSEGYEINVSTLIRRLQREGIFEKVGGQEKMNKLVEKGVTASSLKYYIDHVKEQYTRRKLIAFGKEILNWGYMESENIEKIFQKIETKFYLFQEEKILKNFYKSSELIQEVYTDITIKLNKTEKIGFQSSFQDLDSILQGFQKSDLIIIAGRPSMGKTAFSLNLGKNIVKKYNIPLLIFSLEMSRQQIIYRFLSSESNIYSNRIKAGKMTLEEWKKLTLAMNIISELPIYIDDNSNMSVSEIKAKLQHIFLGQEKKEAILIIDYLQLMKMGSKSETRAQEISTITRNLKILAKEFQIPIFLLSQLSRNLESRIN